MLRNHLIFHTGALGDFILSWPLAMALSRLYPQGRTIYITHGDKGRLAEALLGVESADIDRGWSALWSPAADLPAPCAAMLAGAAGIYSFAAGEDDPAGRNLKALAPRAAAVFLRTAPADGFAGHAVEYLVRQLRAMPALAECVAGAARHLGRQGVGRRRGGDGRLLAIHPGSGSARKCWPPGRFVEAARAARDEGMRVRFIVGEAELERWPADRMEALSAAGEVCRPRTYLEMAGLLQEAAAYLGNDSGPSHLAGIMGVPTLCIFGPTNPRTWAPWGPAVSVIAGEDVEAVAVAQVNAGLKQLLSRQRA